MPRAAFEDMCLKGLVQLGPHPWPFAGHSPGNFPALAAVANILPNPPLIATTMFYRSHGSTMCDKQGCLNYATCHVQTHREARLLPRPYPLLLGLTPPGLLFHHNPRCTRPFIPAPQTASSCRHQ